MTSRVVTVRPDNPVSAAVSRMIEMRFSALPVVDEAYRLVGIISLLDVLRHREDGGSDDASVGSVMNQDVLSLPPHASLGLLAHRLRTYGELRVMPIVERKVLVGVVTRSDLLRGRSRRGPLTRLIDRLRGEDLADLPPVAPRSGRRTGDHVRDIMSTPVVTARVNETTDDVAARLVGYRFTSLPVVDDHGGLAGIVSEADLLGREPLSGRTGRTVAAVMTSDVVTLSPGDTVENARLLVAERGLRVVPVIDDGVLVGVVSRSDLI